MITLPNECYYAIFKNLRSDSKNLFLCALVNRQWCKLIIPMLWNDPEKHFENIRFIKIFLLTLNAEEQALLIPFKISLPIHPKPLFEYTYYITSINYKLYYGVRNWLCHIKYIKYKPYKTGCELENAVICSLITMFLRTSKNLKHICLNEILCNQLILENLYKNTTIATMKLHNIGENFKPKAINALSKVLYKNSTLISLDLSRKYFGFRVIKELTNVLCENNTLNYLNLNSNSLGSEGGKALANVLFKNTTIISLDLTNNKIKNEGIKALADALCKNSTLENLCLWHNCLGSSEGKVLAYALCKNSTLTSLNLGFNNLGSEGGKALADALCKNSTLTSLNLWGNNLGSEGGKALADALCKNSTLTSLNLRKNNLGSEGGKAFADALCKNIALKDLDLRSNKLGYEERKALAYTLSKCKIKCYKNII